MTTHYFHGGGKFPILLADLAARIPVEGEVADHKNNPNLERFRIAQNLYYDAFNNGGCNTEEREFRRTFNIPFAQTSDEEEPFFVGGSRADQFFANLEAEMDKIIQAAWDEQFTPMGVA